MFGEHINRTKMKLFAIRNGDKFRAKDYPFKKKIIVTSISTCGHPLSRLKKIEICRCTHFNSLSSTCEYSTNKKKCLMKWYPKTLWENLINYLPVGNDSRLRWWLFAFFRLWNNFHSKSNRQTSKPVNYLYTR